MQNIIFKTRCNFSIANLQQKVRLPGDINKMIFDKRTEIEGDEIDELEAWIDDLDQWIKSYKERIEMFLRLEMEFKTQLEVDLSHWEGNTSESQRVKIEWEEDNQKISNGIAGYHSGIYRAEKAKKLAEEQLKMNRDNFLPNRDMFHKWGYTKTNSQNLQHKHNPFKIN